MKDAPAGPRILLADDDVELVELLKEYLELEGFPVEAVHDGLAAARRAASGEFGLVVLDVMMPRANGIEALRCIRAKSSIPVLMLTAKGEDQDRIAGLELGADDYVPKPCTPRELTARIRAILRRADAAPAGAQDSEPVRVGALAVWPDRRLAEWQGRPVELTSTEFNLLEVLARNAGKPVTKEALSAQGLGRPFGQFDRSIGVHMSSIRRKLAEVGMTQSFIETVHGIGYQLIRS